MKKIFAFVLGAAFLATSISMIEKGGVDLEIGSSAPLSDRMMMSVSGKKVALKDVMLDNGVLVIFSCNTCPFVIGKTDSEGWQGRYNEVFETAKKNKIGGILVNSNEAKRDKGDSYQDMIKQSDDNKYKVDYVLDEDHILADAFGAKTTPHVFLFDGNYKLVYRGAIDDNNDAASSVTANWLKDALNNLGTSKQIDPNKTRAIGCSIKRVSK